MIQAKNQLAQYLKALKDLDIPVIRVGIEVDENENVRFNYTLLVDSVERNLHLATGNIFDFETMRAPVVNTIKNGWESHKNLKFSLWPIEAK